MEKEERRTAPRVKVNLPARWEGVLSRESATVTSLSQTGCFVLTAGLVEKRELLWLEVTIPQVEPISVWAEVVDQAYEIGFAVRFTSSSDEDEQRLTTYITEELKGAAN
jgi:PilZ domain